MLGLGFGVGLNLTLTLIIPLTLPLTLTLTRIIDIERHPHAQTHVARATLRRLATDVEQYANLSTWLGVRYQPIPEFQLLARFAVENELPHFLTTADAGRDLDPALDNAVEQSNSFGVNEFNPVYNEVYDALRSRFRSGGRVTYLVTVGMQGHF